VATTRGHVDVVWAPSRTRRGGVGATGHRRWWLVQEPVVGRGGDAMKNIYMLFLLFCISLDLFYSVVLWKKQNTFNYVEAEVKSRP
jgi:hypothetical protein